MHIVITGGSGFVGQALTHLLVQKGHHVTILTSHPDHRGTNENIQDVGWLSTQDQPENELKNVDAIVNLAGESLNNGRWTQNKKKAILNSRIKATREVIRIIKELKPMPKVLINASAVGYYGMSESLTFDDTSISYADDFLAKVVKRWENEASTAKSLGLRTVYTRFGMILGQEGALPRMILPYKLGVGGRLGNGQQCRFPGYTFGM